MSVTGYLAALRRAPTVDRMKRGARLIRRRFVDFLRVSSSAC